jgi:hypothetical protein
MRTGKLRSRTAIVATRRQATARHARETPRGQHARRVAAVMVVNLLAVQEDVRVAEYALEPQPYRRARVVARQIELLAVPTLSAG